LDDLQIDTLVATPETVKALKDLRAELNKELKTFEEQRLMVKKAVSDPYAKFEELYKTEISEKYTQAVSKLKDKIAIVETKIKDDKLVEIKAYFAELCVAEKLDFLTWEVLGIEVNLSTTVKKYRDNINEFVTKVQTELALIATNEFKAEILVEYKGSLNVADAITKVQTRKKKEAEEKERIKQEVKEGRINAIEDLGMELNDMVATYEYPDNLGCVFISLEDIEKLETEAFTTKIIEIERVIKKAKAKAQEKERSTEIAEGTTTQAVKPAAPIAAPVAAPRRQPAAVQQTIPEPAKNSQAEKVVTAKFQVTGPYAALKALGQYMKDNNLKYQNLN
jgi:hypothetical protein